MNKQKNKEITSSPTKPHATHEIRASMYRGPIPPADDLIKYEQACPGAADRIISMAENQAKHRQGLEAKVIGSNVQNEKTGMYLAFSLTVLLILIGTYLIMNDKPVYGFLAIFIPCLFQAGSYVYNKYQEHQHAKPKKNESSQRLES